MRVAILLAAGASRRFGRQDKLKARIAGRTLLDHAVANARDSGGGRLVVVTSRPVRIAGASCVRARDAADGLSASLAAGLRALKPIEREAFIFLADMPFARAPAMRIPLGYDAVRPLYHGAPGHPVLIRLAAARAALERGDGGLGGRLRTAFVRGCADHILDIDTIQGLRQARRPGSYRPRRRCALG